MQLRGVAFGNGRFVPVDLAERFFNLAPPLIFRSPPVPGPARPFHWKVRLGSIT